MVLFLIAQAQAWARGLSLDCGCFGTLTHEQVGLWTIVRDVSLGVPSLVMALYPARLLSVDAAFLVLPDRCTSAVVGVFSRVQTSREAKPWGSHAS
jgi:hypothetical protein